MSFTWRTAHPTFRKHIIAFGSKIMLTGKAFIQAADKEEQGAI